MVFKGELSVELSAKDVEVETCANVKPQTRPSHYGEGSQTTKALVLFGFSIMHK